MSFDFDNELMADIPSSEQKIRKLLQEDDTFKEIMEDYLFCKRELLRLSSKKSGDLMQKYSETLEDLREELLLRIKEN